MYVQAAQSQQTKGVRGFLRGKRGLDKVCWRREFSVLGSQFSVSSATSTRRSFTPTKAPGSSPFGAATFVGLSPTGARRILKLDKLRLEDVASGYWTLFVKQSSGLVSHYGSTPSSSARPSTISNYCVLGWWCYNRLVWQTAYRLAILPGPG